MEVEADNLTWADFRTRLERKFLLQAEEGVQLEKFIHLKQGDMNMLINPMSLPDLD